MDYTALATSVTGEVTSALAAVIAIAALILGAKVGYRIFKSFVR